MGSSPTARTIMPAHGFLIHEGISFFHRFGGMLSQFIFADVVADTDNHSQMVSDKYPMRKYLDIIQESYLSYPVRLDDAHEIAEYISSIASDYVDEEMIEEYFHGCIALLRYVPIEEIQEGDKDHNIRSAKKEKSYAKMDASTIPPLVIENGVIMDGNHRYRVALKLGLDALWCYEVQEA